MMLDFVQEEIDELFQLCRSEVQQKIKIPVSDCFVDQWIPEEFVELLVSYLIKKFDINSPLVGFK